MRAERAELVQAVREIGDLQRRDNLNSNSRNDRSVHPERRELAGLMDRVVFLNGKERRA